jgi:sodium transport system permease protein
MLAAQGLPERVVRPFEMIRRNVAPPEKVGGNLVGGFVPYLIIVLCFTGAMYPAIDVTAGEKERGTMETLLCSPAARVEIVLGKFLLVLTGSLSAMAMSLLSMGVTALVTGTILLGGRLTARMVPAPATSGYVNFISPWGLLGVLAVVFPVAILFSAVQLTIALVARNTKEAQSYLGPAMIVVLLPAIVGMLPGVDLDARLAWVPLLNLSLVCKEMLSGVWHWGYIAIVFGSTCLYAAIALGLAVKMFERERVLFRA